MWDLSVRSRGSIDALPPSLPSYLLGVAAGDVLVEGGALTGGQAGRLIVQELGDAGRVLKVVADTCVGEEGREGMKEEGKEE